jgi:manganese/iron transport system substrate-binding protein
MYPSKPKPTISRTTLNLSTLGIVTLSLSSCFFLRPAPPNPQAQPSKAQAPKAESSKADSSPQASTTQALTTQSPTILATASVLCDLAQQIIQNDARITCLIPPGQDPHSYEPTPIDRQAIETASLILYGGYDFEPKILKLITNSPAPKLAVFETAVPKPLLGESDHHDDDHPADHPGEPAPDRTGTGATPDPHVWHSATNAAAIVTTLLPALNRLKLNPQHQASNLYQTRAQTLVQQFGQLDSWIKTQTATIPTPARKLVTTHSALGYYAQAYGLQMSGALSGLSSDEQPTPATLKALTEQVRSSQIPAIFATASGPANQPQGDSEASRDRKLLDTLAQEAKVAIAPQPLYVDGPGALDSPAPTTQRMLVHNTCTIVKALGGTCDPESAPL